MLRVAKARNIAVKEAVEDFCKAKRMQHTEGGVHVMRMEGNAN